MVSRRVVDVMSEMWPEMAEHRESFDGLSAGLNAVRGTARTRAVLWVAPTFIAIGREKPGVGHRVVVERFAGSEIVSVVEEEGGDGPDAAAPRSSIPRPLARLAGRSGTAGGLVITTRRGRIDFTAAARDRDSIRRAYTAIANLAAPR